VKLDFEDLSALGFDIKLALSYTGGAEQLLSVIQRFYRSYEKMRASIEESERDEALDTFTRNVHSLKSNALMIGSAPLSERAKKLEECGKAGDLSSIHALTPELLENYASVIKMLEPYGNMEQIKLAGEIGAAEARETGAALVAALEDFDDDAATRLTDRLMGYPFRFTQKNMLKKVKENLENFEYDEALELVRAVLEQIED
jgi:HPt (histidine-containing phosphotransfer) domain-containing protein